MKVVLLGAGASRAFAASETGQPMPLAADFFATYRKLRIYDEPWVLRGKLFHYIRTHYGVDPEQYLSENGDIEQIHSEVERRLLDCIRDRRSLARILLHGVFTELSFIFACVVNTIGKGPVSTAHQRLAQVLSPDDVIITFNWDTLMDRALQAETGWSVDQGYCFSPRQVFRNGWNPPSPGFPRAPKLLKLHGSSNWITSYSAVHTGDFSLTQSCNPDTVWVVEDASLPYDCYAGRFMPGYGRLSFGYYPPNIPDDRGRSAPAGYAFMQVRPKHPLMPEGSSGSGGLDSMPLIIPPVRSKRYDLYGSLFTGLWAQAQAALTAADTILIIGYSFPQTDLKSIELFEQSSLSRNSVPDVVILDPFPERTADVVRRTLGIPPTSLTVFSDYFTGDFNLGRLPL